MTLHLFGIRHHGPGCARALAAALESLVPDIVLVEGPPEGEEVLHLAALPEMEPPVAMLVYQPDKPESAVFYPFATFSPEWTAVQYAAKHGVPLRFIDLPWQHRFALDDGKSDNQTDDTPIDHDETQEKTEGDSEPVEKTFEQQIIDDPLAVLSQLAGFDDTESWWEQVIEQSLSSDGIFSGIMDIMTELRERTANEVSTRESRRHEPLREAWMRKCIRAAIKVGHQKIAVVCGAWHAPVLDVLAEDESHKALIPSKKDDDALLTKLPKTKVTTTWTPWTYSRLAYRSGYGAGVSVPGWYDHLWTTPDRAVTRWISRAARLLRDESLDASSASVIEAVRLADALAAMRDRPLPGLAEVNEAILTVLCHGDVTPLRLIRRRLDTGQRIGRVPAETPSVPLLKDIEREQKQLRMKVSEEIVTLDLDLRKDTDRAKSRLLHRLQLLGVPWGKPQITAVRSTGTFHEFWQTQWQVEFVVRIIEANSYGNTLETAVAGAVRARAEAIRSIPEITALIEAAIPAELPATTIDDLLVRLQNDAAVSSDISGLMLALVPLVNVIRYGNVRGTQMSQVEPVFNALFQRVLVGLVAACGSLDDDAAARRVEEIVAVQSALDLHNHAEDCTDWQRVLAAITNDDTLHGMLRGSCCRLLYEQGVLSHESLAMQITLAVTPALEAAKVAQWMQGFLQGSGQTLLQFDPLWDILNHWLCTLSDDMFQELVALLRRSFSDFSAPELRMMGQKIKKLHVTTSGETVTMTPKENIIATHESRIDLKRVEKVLPVLEMILKKPV
ncbi:MAG: DUF5682 family protein [Planctomycetaceae bacterium]|nr:DUF5682 family protein [Planctomycetaceae bacterium]